MFFSGVTFAQTQFLIEKIAEVDPKSYDPGFEARIDNLEAPVPGGESYRGFLREQKVKVREMFPLQPAAPIQNKTQSMEPGLLQGFVPARRFPAGNTLPLTGGIPNDNTLAISNDGILLIAINSVVWAYDTKNDSVLFPNTVVALQTFADGSANHSYYDPKLYYDEDADRFILTFLRDNRPNTSQVIMCFSSSNNPTDPWNAYVIPGNPLNNNRWTDFPALATTKDEVFYTANLIIPDVSWQVGFDGSVIWQLDKFAGYAGNATLPSKLWSDVRHNGRFTRNLFPVPGAAGDAEDIFFLSNRNFDLQNDTFFVAHITGKLDDPNAALEVKAVVADVPYGLAPNGRQANTVLTDPTSGLDINDARVLGGFLLDDQIQFTSTAVNPATGLAAIYHGVLNDPKGNTSIDGTILGDPTLDIAYPNIVWTGIDKCQKQAMIGFNYTSPNDFAGVAAIFYDNQGNYSNLKRLKEGENIINRIPGTYDRWGDYFGLQRVFNDPRKVFAAGMFGLQNNLSGTFVAELISPDTMLLEGAIAFTGNPAFCQGVATATGIGGVPPYTYEWLSPLGSTNEIASGICSNDKVSVRITDATGCETIVSADVLPAAIAAPPLAYPSPFVNQVAVQFELPRDQEIVARIYTLQGQLVDEVIRKSAKAGLNELTFFTEPLSSGTYVLVISVENREIFSQKIIKQDP